MHEREESEAATCAVCGEPLDASDPTNYQISTESTVCGACAHRHGGVYNPELEEWAVRPRVPIHLQRPENEI